MPKGGRCYTWHRLAPENGRLLSLPGTEYVHFDHVTLLVAELRNYGHQSLYHRG